jgi:S1-C subfamily serine protease
LSRDDRSRKHLDEDLKGVLVTSVAGAGWAALGGLQGGDIILRAGDQLVESIPTLKILLAKIEKDRPAQVVLFVRRGIATRYLELEPVW